MSSDPIFIRPLNPGEEGVVCDLVARVFKQFVANDYPADGVEEFFRYSNPAAMALRREAGELILVAQAGSEIIGMLELDQPDQLSLLFVETAGHGVGRRLVEQALEIWRTRAPGGERVRVHASRYAVPFYRRVGFTEEGPETTENGITYLPMVREQVTGA
jgi:GNAT superfamily N-acetyltransferase